MRNDLATKIREDTSYSHTIGENTAFSKCFLKGIVEKDPLRKLLADVYFLYSALEEKLQRHPNHLVVGQIYFSELNRQHNLEDDLVFYYGKNWREKIVKSPAGRVYVNRSREVSNTESTLLVAHSYIRYMGYLSGGQSLKNIIHSALELISVEGTKFYELDEISNPEAKRDFKVKYRNTLNSLPIDDRLAKKIIDEANASFRLNCDVVYELEDDVRAAITNHVFELITHQDKPGSTKHHYEHGHSVGIVTAG